jgi:hypothetical protein
VSNSDQQKWDDKYAEGLHSSSEPSTLVTGLRDLFPFSQGRFLRAIDVAGGAGRHALWLAQQGFDTTLVDISKVALSIAEQRASSAGSSLHVRAMDLDESRFPSGPWDVIVDFHYLSRPLFPRMIAELSLGGLLIVVQPTVRNLERHPKPSAEYLLAENELPSLVDGLKILQFEEGWLAEGRHEARIVAQRID